MDTFERALYVAVHAVNNLKAGGVGAFYWTLHDIYYGESPPDVNNGGLMQFGLWAYRDAGSPHLRIQSGHASGYGGRKIKLAEADYRPLAVVVP